MRVEPDLLGQAQEHVLARRALEVVEHGGELGLRGQELLLDHDRQAEVDRQHDQPQRAVVLGDEVVERGHHPVARPALVLGVGHRRVQPPPLEQVALPGRIPARRHGWRYSSGMVSGS